jgi:hypothetical protein
MVLSSVWGMLLSSLWGMLLPALTVRELLSLPGMLLSL